MPTLKKLILQKFQKRITQWAEGACANTTLRFFKITENRNWSTESKIQNFKGVKKRHKCGQKISFTKILQLRKCCKFWERNKTSTNNFEISHRSKWSNMIFQSSAIFSSTLNERAEGKPCTVSVINHSNRRWKTHKFWDKLIDKKWILYPTTWIITAWITTTITTSQSITVLQNLDAHVYNITHQTERTHEQDVISESK